MAALTIDLDAQLENLRGLKSDLEEFYHSSGAVLTANDREGVSVAVGQLAQRIIALEEIARRCESDEVRVEEVTRDESRALDQALVVLDAEFCPSENAPPATIWSRIRRLLAATDDLLFTAARAVRVPAAGDVPSTGRGVVVALSRRAR